MSDESKIIVEETGTEQPVPEEIVRSVREYELATGIKPQVAPRPSTAANPRAHLPQYPGKMPGEMPDDHPEKLRRIQAHRNMMAREKERDSAKLKQEADVLQRLRVGTRVVIGANAKVDFEEADGTRVTGDYAGIEGEIFQTYVDTEGVRRCIIIDRDPASGRSRYAPVGVRECDLTERGKEARVFSFASPQHKAEQRAEHRAEMEQKSQEEIERAAFGGKTAKELADLMCGL